MKFLFHFYDLQQRAGIQRAICELSNALSADGHEVVIVSKSSRSQTAYPLDERVVLETSSNPELPKGGLRAWAPKFFWGVRQCRQLRKLVRMHAPAIVVDHGTALGLVYPFSRMAGVPFVLQRHFPARSFPHGRLMYRVLSAFTRAKTLVVLTEAIATEMRQLGFTKVLVIPNLVPAGAQPSPYSEARPRTGLLIGRAGNPQKGFDLFLEALACQPIRDWQFQIVGPGVDTDPLLRTLVQRYRLETQVELKAPTSDPYRLIRESSCLIMPSRYEGLPMLALEALSIGRPLLASDVDGLRELIVPGINGALFPSGNVIELSTALQDFTANPATLEEMALAASASVEGFRSKVILAKWRAAVAELAGLASD